MSPTQTEASTETAAALVELVPDALYLLGSSIALDGRISWVPPEARGWQPSNCYVLLDDGHCLVVDPGPAVLGDVVVEQLQQLLPAGSPVSIFVTRAEPDTTGGIGAIARAFPVDRLYAGGGPNPFDSFEAAGEVQFGDRRERIQLERMPAGFRMPVGPARDLQVIPPSLRLLATWWAYDAATATLFTSDSFTHTLNELADGPRRLTAAMPAQQDPTQVAGHLTSKFEWLRHAKTTTLLDGVRALFDEYDVGRIAPAHGLVLEGRDVVHQHVEAVLEVLTDLAS
ncbi:MAG: hypothetical protein WD794_08225 [Mycobacteriales bacterium]